MTNDSIREGGCACSEVRYRMHGDPLFIHCCHCRWCQRETGSAFVLNALIEADRIEVTAGEPVGVLRPSDSGSGQMVWQCETCRVVLWSTYSGAGEGVRFVRAGTLDDTTQLSPDIHIFTESKQPWMEIPEGTPAVPRFYRYSEYWPAESIARMKQAAASS